MSSEELRKRLQDYVEQAVDIRFSFEIPDLTAGPVELNHALISAQMALTEIERLLSNSIRAKAALDRRCAQARMVWQAAFDKALMKPGKSFGSEFASSKEKSADANLAAFDEARALREIEEETSFANEAVDVIRLHYYGLDKVRQDVRKRLDMSQSDYYTS